MTPLQMDSAISRILSGEFRCNILGKNYILVNPSRELRYRAQVLHDEILYESYFEDWFSKDEIVSVLIKNGLWDIDGDAKLAQCGATLDDFKLTLYEATIKSKKKEIDDTRKKIKQMKAKMNEMGQKRHSLDHHTIEAFASMARSQYIALNSILDENRKSVDLSDDFYTVNGILNESYAAHLSQTELRGLGRYNGWRFIWDASKTNPFGVDFADWTDEQRSLFNVSTMYDNIHQHYEAPPEYIIEDDDLLDGWMIHQRKKREREKNEAEMDRSGGKRKNHLGPVDMFIPVATQDDAKKVKDMNDPEAQTIIEKRKQAVLTKGEATDLDLPDVRHEIAVKAAALTKEQINGARKR